MLSRELLKLPVASLTVRDSFKCGTHVSMSGLVSCWTVYLCLAEGNERLTSIKRDMSSKCVTDTKNVICSAINNDLISPAGVD